MVLVNICLQKISGIRIYAFLDFQIGRHIPKMAALRAKNGSFCMKFNNMAFCLLFRYSLRPQNNYFSKYLFQGRI